MLDRDALARTLAPLERATQLPAQAFLDPEVLAWEREHVFSGWICAGHVGALSERGAFLSLPDFLARSRARADETESLILCGAFDAFDRTRPEMLWRLHLLTAPARRLPASLPGESPLDPALIAACRTTPEERARESARTPPARGGWSKPAIQIGAVASGEEVTLFPLPSTPPLALPLQACR